MSGTGLAFPKPTRRLPSERKRVAKASKRPSALDKAMADWLCAALVKQRAGNRCEAKGYADIACSRTLDWAHGWPRRYYTVRWAHANTWCICRAHHQLFTIHWPRWIIWRRDHLGIEPFQHVNALVNGGRRQRVDMAHVLAELRAGRTQVDRS